MAGHNGMNQDIAKGKTHVYTDSSITAFQTLLEIIEKRLMLRPYFDRVELFAGKREGGNREKRAVAFVLTEASGGGSINVYLRPYNSFGWVTECVELQN